MFKHQGGSVSMAAKSSRKPKSTKSSSKRTTAKKTSGSGGIREEIVILCILAVCILLTISNFGLGGLVGKLVSSVMFGVFGWMAYPVPILLFCAAAFLMSNRGNAHAYIKTAAAIVLILLICTFLELIVNPYESGTTLFTYYRQASEHRNAGGLLGGCMVMLLCPAIGEVGTYVVVIILAAICGVLITEKSLLKPLGKGGKKVYEGAKRHRETSAVAAAQRRKERTQERKREQDERRDSLSAKAAQKVAGVSFNTTLTEPHPDVKSPELTELKTEPFASEDPEQGKSEQDTQWPVFAPESMQADAVSETGLDAADAMDYAEGAAAAGEGSQENIRQRQRRQKTDESNTAVDTSEVEESIHRQEAVLSRPYTVPPLNLLKRGTKSGGNSNAQLRATALKLEQTLMNFGVKVHVTDASCGPSVTRYELQPDQGVKVSRIVGLADDIKLNLAVSDLRIEAPIPGKAAVGIEVPNSENTAVMLRDLLESEEFKNSKSGITFAVGKDIAGKTVVADIAKMPHLLVAGSTGSGKSVCINTIIMSIIYKSNPEDVKLIMVDPKVVELNVYNGIPHLLIPVVTDPRKAAGALNWAVAEMMKRYQLFAEYNVRDLKGFNEKIAQMPAGEDVPKKMAQIVIIVDELADLMMVAPKDVEGAICRLAQLARAAGLHLILATQRPSVNVITGLIKANMPSRIAFAVSSGVDSRTIIDMNGAEKLLGKGDMLFYPTGYPKPVRVQGSFVSDKEVQNVVEYLIENHGKAAYSEELEEHMSREPEQDGAVSISGAAAEEGDEKDHYFAEAGRLIIDKEKASIGMLQRMFKIGFNRAARIMDQLAEAGVVGPEEGTKPRKVLMSKEEFEQYLTENA